MDSKIVSCSTTCARLLRIFTWISNLNINLLIFYKNDMLQKVNIDYLEPGMYVSRLDRPWIETPYMFQGFLVNNSGDIEEVKKHCKFVYVDAERGLAPKEVMAITPSTEIPEGAGAALPERKAVYLDTEELEVEITHARSCHSNLSIEINNLMDAVRTGKRIDLENTQETVDSMIESIVRNPDAFVWLTRLKEADAYTYSHAIDSSILSIAFGRHLGLSKQELQDMAIGGMLFDIGKMKISSKILGKKGRLTKDEFGEIKKHVEYSVEIMSSTKGVSDHVVEIARHHHERHDGSGYPRGLQGDQIPVFSRMLAIVDCYDAITSDRPYGNAISSHSAAKKLYEWRGIDFHEELVEQFIQCLGVYPTGSLVELSTGEVGIVMSQNRMRRLRPKVMLIMDSNKAYYGGFPTIDLKTELEDKNGDPLDIVGCPEPGTYGIDPKEFYL